MLSLARFCQILGDNTLSLTCSRQVTIVHYPLGLLLLALRVITLTYILVQFIDQYSYLDTVPVTNTAFNGVKTPTPLFPCTLQPDLLCSLQWVEETDAFWTGKGQTYVDPYNVTQGRQALDVYDPYYCHLPFT